MRVTGAIPRTQSFYSFQQSTEHFASTPSHRAPDSRVSVRLLSLPLRSSSPRSWRRLPVHDWMAPPSSSRSGRWCLPPPDLAGGASLLYTEGHHVGLGVVAASGRGEAGGGARPSGTAAALRRASHVFFGPVAGDGNPPHQVCPLLLLPSCCAKLSTGTLA